MAVDKEMDAVFKSSRTDKDPVSGNEVPTGSLPEEVRDDIPAQLSEGEYVVPADVVRYYGVKFFEDLRAIAKEGWNEMEANGRIGGEPVDGMEIVEPEDDLPFDEAELIMIDDDDGEPVEMFLGGFLKSVFGGGDKDKPKDKPSSSSSNKSQPSIGKQINFPGFENKNVDAKPEPTPRQKVEAMMERARSSGYKSDRRDSGMSLTERAQRSAARRDEPSNRFEAITDSVKDLFVPDTTNPDNRKAPKLSGELNWDIFGSPIERAKKKGLYNQGGYAVGGDIEPLETQPFSFTPAEITTKKYVDSEGNIMYVTFSGDTPLNYIPPEFRPEAEATAAAEAAIPAGASPAVAQQPTVAKDDNTIGNTGMGDVDEAFVKASSGIDWSTASPEAFEKATGRLGSGTGVARALGLVSPVVGLAAGLGLSSQARNNAYDMLDGIAYQLDNNADLTAPQRELLKNQQNEIRGFLNPEDKGGLLEKVAEGTSIFGGESSLYENLSDFTGDDRATFADTWLGDLLGFDNKAGVQGPNLKDSLAGARRGGAPEYAGDASKYKTKTPDTPYQAAMKSKDYDTASSIATNSWVAATNAANSIKDKSSADFHKAIKAQSEASRAATAAIQARTAAKNSNKSSSKKSSSSSKKSSSIGQKASNSWKSTSDKDYGMI